MINMCKKLRRLQNGGLLKHCNLIKIKVHNELEADDYIGAIRAHCAAHKQSEEDESSAELVTMRMWGY